MSEADEAAFQASLRIAGLSVNPDRYAAMLAAYRDFRAYLRVLDTPFTYGDEPAVTYRMAEPPL